MPKSEKQKLKTLYVAKFFLENSDENHAVTANDILDYLKEECSIEAERRSIYRDIALLRDEFGMDIDSEPGGRYKLLSRQFEFDDLHVIAECIHAAKFISAAKAKELVEMIGELGSIYQAERLNREVFLTDRVKTTQKGTLSIISTIYAAMPGKQNRYGKQISFKYLKHTINDLGTMVERHSGKLYVVAPLHLIINDGYYYMLAYDQEANTVKTYRIDRMKHVQLLEGMRYIPRKLCHIDLKDYTKRVFSMFTGQRRNITMQFTNDLLDAVIDRFGTNSTSYSKLDDEHFSISTEVEVSNQFYSWLLQFGDKAKILYPHDVVNGLRSFLEMITLSYSWRIGKTRPRKTPEMDETHVLTDKPDIAERNK